MNLLDNHHYIKNNFDVTKSTTKTNNTTTENKISFTDVLSKQAELQNKVSFSKHANMRINARNINLTTEQMDRLEQGVDKARTKGINDSLVLIDDLALVVNVKNNVVVTAVENNDKVFTNIDGAVIA